MALLCNLLLERYSIAIPACECLLVLVSRRGKSDEHEELVVLFEKLDLFYNAFTRGSTATSFHSDIGYQLQKRLCQTLTNLGMYQLPVKRTIETAFFPKYLDLMLIFANHPSLLLSSFTIPLWSTLLRMPAFQRDEELIRVLPLLLSFCLEKIIKQGDPERNDDNIENHDDDKRDDSRQDTITLFNSFHKNYHLSQRFLEKDFDTSEEFQQFFSMYRNQLVEILRLLTEKCPSIVMMYTSNVITSFLQKPIVLSRYSPSGYCALFDPYYLQLEACTMFLDAVMNGLSKRFDQPDEMNPEFVVVRDTTLSILQQWLLYSTEDALLLTRSIAALNSLFFVIPWNSSLLSALLERLLSYVLFRSPKQLVFTNVETLDWSSSEDTLTVRRHAILALVKLAGIAASLLMVIFNAFFLFFFL